MSVKLFNLFDRLPLLAVIQAVFEFLKELLLLVKTVYNSQVVLILQIELFLIQFLKTLLLLRDCTVLSDLLLLVNLRVLKPRLHA